MLEDSEGGRSAHELKQAFLSVPKPGLREVHVPEAGVTLFVLTLSAKEKDRFEKSLVEGKGRNQKVSTENLRAKYCARCMVDANGVRLFADAEFQAIGDLPAAVVDRVYLVISEANSVTTDDLEELAGNSPRESTDTSS